VVDGTCLLTSRGWLFAVLGKDTARSASPLTCCNHDLLLISAYARHFLWLPSVTDHHWRADP
jgi:hypothetical protein